MKLVRRAQLWLTVFFAPTIVVLAASGLALVLGWHEPRSGATSSVMVRLAQVHRAQTLARPPAPIAPPRAAAGDNLGVDRAAAARFPAPRPARPQRSTATKAFFVITALAVIATTMIGVVIALEARRDRRLVIGVLAAGTVVPLVLVLL